MEVSLKQLVEVNFSLSTCHKLFPLVLPNSLTNVYVSR